MITAGKNELKGRSQLCDFADLDTSFSHFEKVYLDLKSKLVQKSASFFYSVFNRLLKNLFLSVLCSSYDIIFIISG